MEDIYWPDATTSETGGELPVENQQAPLALDKKVYWPSTSDGSRGTSQEEIGRSLAGIPQKDQIQLSRAETYARDALGSAYSDESIIDGPQDTELGWKFGWAETPEKKRQIIKELYGEDADVRLWEFQDGSRLELATKDGKSWKNTEGLYDWLPDLPTLGAELAYGSWLGGPGMSVLRTGGAAVVGGLSTFMTESLLKSLYEPERGDPATKAGMAALMSGVGQGVGDYLLGPILMRHMGAGGSPGGRKAVDAAQEEGLPLPTGGQYTSNRVAKYLYKQFQNVFPKSAKVSLARFAALGEKLHKDVKKYGVGHFSDEELAALGTQAAIDIEMSIAHMSSGVRPIQDVVPRMQEALSTYNEALKKSRNIAYKDAFDIAVRDEIEFDMTPVKEAFKEVKKGVPIKAKDSITGGGTGTLEGSTALTRGDDAYDIDIPYEVGVESPPLRALTPNAELSRIIEFGEQIHDNLSHINPDGDVVGSLQQLDAFRRSLSDFAFNAEENNQRRLASTLLAKIDETLENPVAGASMDYLDAFRQAKNTHQVFSTVNELKSVSKLDGASIEEYRSYVTGLLKPGKGEFVEFLKEKVFKAYPGLMEDIQGSFIDTLKDSPRTIAATLSRYEKQDPKLLRALVPTKADEKLLKNYGQMMSQYKNSWIAQQAERTATTEGSRALRLFEGGAETVDQNVADFLKFGGPNAKENLQVALLNKIIKESETIDSELLGQSMIDGQAFSAAITKYDDYINTLFDERGIKRLKNYQNYAVKLAETAVDVPPTKKAHASGATTDSGTSLVTAMLAGGIGKMMSMSAAQASRFIFRSIGSPYIINKIINFDGPIVTETMNPISNVSLRAIQNVTLVLPNLLEKPEPASVPERYGEELRPLQPQGM